VTLGNNGTASPWSTTTPEMDFTTTMAEKFATSENWFLASGSDFTTTADFTSTAAAASIPGKGAIFSKKFATVIHIFTKLS